MLVATELVTNAVRHSMCEEHDVLRVSVRQEAGQVRVSVLDPGRSGGTARISAGDGWAGGLGLKIVEQLARQWGSNRSADGYEVWAELAIVTSGPTRPSPPESRDRAATSSHLGR
jgi:anti-sigma regulatory factor (Ser/Thr protein kinase)